VVSDIQDKLKTVSIPSDVIVEIGGSAEDQQESFRYLSLALLAGIILVYMVMASQFESLLDPFIIMVTVPLSFIGVALALFITHTTLSLMALIGMLILVGIVVNNGIVLVDFTNILRREQGKELFEAALEAGRTRMRPVLMTALTTIFGMLPLALGLGESGETWAPLARAVMGGLTTATILTLVVVPVMYTVFESLALRFHSWRERRQMKLQPAEPAEV
jgi:HAE1 family hydrophobic/amphiphilic exporter-1